MPQSLDEGKTQLLLEFWDKGITSTKSSCDELIENAADAAGISELQVKVCNIHVCHCWCCVVICFCKKKIYYYMINIIRTDLLNLRTGSETNERESGCPGKGDQELGRKGPRCPAKSEKRAHTSSSSLIF
jgi:hypothetical protein